MEVELLCTLDRYVDGVVMPKLCHGDTVVTVSSGKENVENCDAIVTTNKELALGITTADCAPICFADGEKIAIAHVGWRGLCLGLVEKVVSQFGSSTPEVYVAPHLFTFEIQKDFCYDTVTQKFGERFLRAQEGKIIFNFRDAIASLLPGNAVFDPRSTGEDLTFPSHRRNGTHERLVTVVKFLKA